MDVRETTVAWDLDLTLEDVMQDLDPGTLAWREDQLLQSTHSRSVEKL